MFSCISDFVYDIFYKCCSSYKYKCSICKLRFRRKFTLFEHLHDEHSYIFSMDKDLERV